MRTIRALDGRNHEDDPVQLARMRGPLSALVAMLLIGACGPLPGGSASSASSVAVQQSDVPSGMQKCDVSGGMDAYITKVQAKDPTHYTQIKQEWEDTKAHGATAGQVAVYADTAAHCATFQTNSSDITTATYKLVVNFVIQFKDEATAAKGYTSETIMGFSPGVLKAGGLPVIEGSATGLSKNSVVLTLEVSTQSFYVAVWQNKKFMVILALLNIDTATDKKVAVAENGRIT